MRASVEDNNINLDHREQQRMSEVHLKFQDDWFTNTQTFRFSSSICVTYCLITGGFAASLSDSKRYMLPIPQGMPLSVLLKLNPLLRPQTRSLRKSTGSHPAERSVYIGSRDVDKGNKEILKKNRIKVFSAHEVDWWSNWRSTMSTRRYLHIHLSFDVDVLDPSVVPSMGTVCVLKEEKMNKNFYLLKMRESA
ncbi:uncharacterized protein EDB93DRAFT_1298160 [Suillus bovinus]|uniref:uncharacterized protein n=1 Tax=Suillus bovinus TaxID=48563 RepID=UPI001B870481|nr:uncharacterized protein EDB93DRAFT_1298160 [Suillus bovinus]KAG2139859.1 hypothetical protein EDB93DRAFT_1298160 [Suillus bovinus]